MDLSNSSLGTYSIYITKVIRWSPRVYVVNKKLTIRASSLSEALTNVPKGWEVSMFWLNWPPLKGKE